MRRLRKIIEMEAEGFPITKASPAPEIGPGICPEIGRMTSPRISPQIGAQIGAGGEPRIGRGRDAQLGPRGAGPRPRLARVSGMSFHGGFQPQEVLAPFLAGGIPMPPVIPWTWVKGQPLRLPPHMARTTPRTTTPRYAAGTGVGTLPRPRKSRLRLYAGEWSPEWSSPLAVAKSTVKRICSMSEDSEFPSSSDDDNCVGPGGDDSSEGISSSSGGGSGSGSSSEDSDSSDDSEDSDSSDDSDSSQDNDSSMDNCNSDNGSSDGYDSEYDDDDHDSDESSDDESQYCAKSSKPGISSERKRKRKKQIEERSKKRAREAEETNGSDSNARVVKRKVHAAPSKMRKCSGKGGCGCEKPLADFHRNGKRSDGSQMYHALCKKCYNSKHNSRKAPSKTFVS